MAAAVVPADPCVSPSFRAYDLLYLPPPSGDLMQPGVVALVVHVCTAYGMGAPGRVPTGDIDVLQFDCSAREFSQELQRVRDVEWELLPPCCGRGAACPHLGRMAPEARQWRSGEHMDIRSLLRIPHALHSWLPYSRAHWHVAVTCRLSRSVCARKTPCS